jgi:hypothetical protein
MPMSKPYGGHKPEVGWSVHMTDGWKAQLDRMRRWHHRASGATDPTDRYDFLCAFFENAFHLRDWLQDSGAVTANTLQAFFDANEDMRLCRDLANSHKHYSLRSPSQPVPPSEAHEYAPGIGNLNSDVSLVILSDGKKHDAFELAGRVLNLWERFITSSVQIDTK